MFTGRLNEAEGKRGRAAIYGRVEREKKLGFSPRVESAKNPAA